MKPLPFQAEDLIRMDKFGGHTLVAWDPGLGKTLLALWWIQNSKAFPAVIITPASIKWQWERKTKEVIGMQALVLEGKKQKPDVVARLRKAEIIIVNYDILVYWLDTLKEIKPITIVMDECQNVSNPKTKRSKACRNLCKRRKHVIGLSATPMLNKPIELFPALQMISPNIFRSRQEFGEEFCDPEVTPWGIQFNGASNTKELHQLLLDINMVRRRKLEVLEQFPSKMRNVVVLPMKDAAAYHRFDKNFHTFFLKWLEKQPPKKAEKAKFAEALVKIGYLRRLAARLKWRFVVEWINTFLEDTDEKLVVFAIHKNAIQALKQGCNSKSVIVDGSVSLKKRQEAVDQFREDKRTRLFIGNIKAAGAGIDGLQIASNVAFAELPWQPGLVTQAEDRVWRIGTTQKVWVWFFVAADTIEERLCEILQTKQKMSSSVLDGGAVDGDLDVLDQLVSELKQS